MLSEMFLHSIMILTCDLANDTNQICDWFKRRIKHGATSWARSALFGTFGMRLGNLLGFEGAPAMYTLVSSSNEASKMTKSMRRYLGVYHVEYKRLTCGKTGTAFTSFMFKRADKRKRK